MSLRSATRALRLALPALLVSCAFGLAHPSWGANFTVRALSNDTFVPSNLAISVGDTVTFRNQGSGFHNVIEDGGAFRCAEGCDGDGQGGDGDPSSSDWSFTLTFPTAGTVGYYCDVHGSPGSGMIGRIQVLTPGQPGTLDLSADAYSAGESSGGAAIVVRRTGGTTGAISVRYAASPGTASAADFTPTFGTLHWADGDGAVKIFSVPITNDALVEGSETVAITLSQPTGSAALGRASAVLTLIDDDIGGGDPPPGSLSDGEVTCDAARLSGLLARSAVSAPRSGRPTSLAFSFTGTGDFAGMAATGIGGGGEAALAFSTNPEETTLLRNPSRPQLFSISLTRNELNSDLAAPGGAGELRLTINPTLDANPPAGNLLAIDNLQAPAGRAADAKPGRGIAPLLATCHGDFRPEDVHLFRVLSKVARGEAPGAAGFEIEIYRAAEPDHYQLDLFPLSGDGTPSGRLSVELGVVPGGGAELTGGTLRRLEPCVGGATTSCSDLSGLAAQASLGLFKPVVAGPPPATPYRITAIGPGEVAVDFADLLAGSSWRRPLN